MGAFSLLLFVMNFVVIFIMAWLTFTIKRVKEARAVTRRTRVHRRQNNTMDGSHGSAGMSFLANDGLNSSSPHGGYGSLPGVAEGPGEKCDVPDASGGAMEVPTLPPVYDEDGMEVV